MASDPTSDQLAVRQAASLGWALTEFLSRCYSLDRTDPPTTPDWPTRASDRDPAPPRATEMRTPRQTVRSLIFHIAYLAQQLGVSVKIPEGVTLANGKSDPCVGAPYTDVLTSDTVKLTELDPKHPDPEHPNEWNECLADINARIYFWDMKIQDGLQCQVAAVYNAYLIARNLAALCWTLKAGARANVPTGTWLQKDCKGFCDAIYLLALYLPDYAAGSLATSAKSWYAWLPKDKAGPGSERAPCQELYEQAEIWQALITGRRDPLTYVDIKETNHTTARYFWRVLRVSWPLLVVALAIVIAALIVALVVVNVYTHAGVSIYIGSAIAGIFAFLTLAGTSLATVNGAWQKGAGNLLGTVGHALTDQLWADAQQEAVNRKTLIPPPPPEPNMAQKPSDTNRGSAHG